MATTRDALLSTDIRLSELDFWSGPLAEREKAFALLRSLPKPAFFPEPEQPVVPMGPGYHALVRHADVVEVSRRPADFRSAPIATTIEDLGADFAEYFGGTMINIDDPRHAKIRRIVSQAYTPRTIQRINDNVVASAAKIVDDLIEQGPSDFVEHVAARLPLTTFCTMMGIPEQYRDTVYRLSDLVVSGADPEYAPNGPAAWAGEVLASAKTLQELAQDLSRHRLAHPADDIVTTLSHANIDGERLTSTELGSFFILLVVAELETTRNAIAHGLHLLTEHPDQRALLMADFEKLISGAVEEILRYATPITWMRRTVSRDGVELNGQVFREGEKVVLFYWSANRDETVFADPGTFDITRNPNPHVAFGGSGPHFCLGAHLARHEITVMFRELLSRLPQLRSTGAPDRLVASFVNGIKRLPCEF